MYLEAMSQSGLKGTHVAVKADERRLAEEAKSLHQGRWSGLNVTMPLKEAAVRFCQRLTSEADGAGSVNTMGLEAGKVVGHSTDTVAVGLLLERDEMDGNDRVVILGGGGAARAAIAAIGDRTAWISTRGDSDTWTEGVRRLAWGEMVEGALLINTTPLGMSGEPLPGSVVEASGGLIDLAYGTSATPAMGEATSRGIPAVDGVEFLSVACAASFEWWTGVGVDSNRLLEAARNV